MLAPSTRCASSPHASDVSDRIFALTVALNERGVFSWTEWAEALSEKLKGGAADGSDYYDRWLAALESLLLNKQIAGAAEIADLTAAWHRAAEATPHGKPILLDNDPLRQVSG